MSIKNPEQFFGFRPGADRHMIRYEDILAYLHHLEENSDRIKVTELGKTMEGKRPFVAAFISDAENLSNLERLREINRKLAAPDLCSQEELDRCVAEGKCFLMVSLSMHCNEVGGTQSSPLMAWELLSNEEAWMRKIRRECVVMMIPCGNPDGEIDFCDWYEKYLGTEHEGCCSPHLRHSFAGHSNNRDGVHVNVDETYYLNRVLMENKPHAFIDHHHQDPWMDRLTITPGMNPMSPECSPLQMRELEWYAQSVAQDLARQKVKGIVTADEFYDTWCYPIQQEIVRLQNIAGVLMEAADALIATPIYVPPEKLVAHVVPSVECPDPWEGGWWHLSDIVNEQCLATYAFLKVMSRNREQILEDMIAKGREQIERGRNDPVGAFLIPRDQWDVSALERLLRILDLQDIRYEELAAPFVKGREVYPEGTYVVPMAQPYYGLAKMILDKCFYPLNRYTKKADGTIRITDMATLNVTDLMGVEAVPAGKGAKFSTRPHTAPARPAGLPASENDTYAAVNRKLANGEAVYRDEQGDFNTEGVGRRVRLARIGVLKMSKTGNSEEGYTRLLFGRFDVPYRVVMDYEIRNGQFDDLDLIVIPGHTEEELTASGEPTFGRPVEYASGLGAAGFENLRKFVQNGGRIVAWEASCSYAAEAGGMPIDNPTAGIGEAQLNSHGSALRVVYEPCELTYGLPREGVVLFRNGPVFSCRGWDHKAGRFGKSRYYHSFARFAKENLLVDGLLVGEDLLVDQSCAMRIECGKGDVIITGFDPKFRNQTDATYKVFFNSLYRYGD